MTKQRKSQVFDRWKAAWVSAFNSVGNKNVKKSAAITIAQLIKDAHKKLPKGYIRNLTKEGMRLENGFRGKNDPNGPLRGEQVIESQLLRTQKVEVKDPQNKLRGIAEFNKHQAYLMNKRGQVKPDLTGSFCFTNKTPHVVSFEVKDTANNCCYALVECCKQVDILRKSPKDVAALAGPNTITRSAWGAVIAPSEYYKDTDGLAKAIEAAKLLHDTELRVAFLAWDSNSKVLTYLGGNWPVK